MEETIQQKLSSLEKEHEVKILLACEVGSRAWGLDAPTSDYDVKFIYVRPLSWYLGIEEVKRDLIDDKSEFDMNGWDLRKALQLLKESNCGILEWLTTKHVYRCEESFVKEARALATSTHCRRSLLLAYWGKAGKHYREYITIVPEDGIVTLKKYLFVIQALLSARWIFAFSLTGTDLPPQDFSTLLDSFHSSSYALPKPIYDTASQLMTKKREGTLKTGQRIKDLDDWITTSLTELETKSKKIERRSKVDISPFNELLARFVTSTSGFVLHQDQSYFNTEASPSGSSS